MLSIVLVVIVQEISKQNAPHRIQLAKPRTNLPFDEGIARQSVDDNVDDMIPNGGRRCGPHFFGFQSVPPVPQIAHNLQAIDYILIPNFNRN